MPIADPRDIPGLVAWYSAEAETGYANDAPMTGWTDLSGNNNHAIVVGGQPPLWKDAGGPGGGPMVQFRATGTSVATWGYFELPANILGGSGSSGEIMVQIKSDGSDASHWWFGTGAGAQSTSHYPYSGTIYETFGVDGNQKAVNPLVSLTAWRRYHVWAAPNDMGIRLDAVQRLTEANVATVFTPVPLLGHGGRSGVPSTFGDATCFRGQMSAVVLYNRTLTATERDDLDAWLTANPDGGTLTAPTGPLTLPEKVDAVVARIRDEINAVRAEQLTLEAVRDLMGVTLAAGANVTITPDDAADTITIASGASGGMTVEEVQDTVAAMLTAGTGVELTYDDVAGTLAITATGGGGGGATTLDALTDVDTTTAAPLDGQVLVYDANTGLWKPGTATEGGPQVGAWENNLETLFTYPPLVETDLQANPPSIPTAKPVGAVIEVTVTEAMLITNAGADLGHGTLLQIIAVMRQINTSTGNPSVEGAHVDAVTNIESVGNTSSLGAPAVNARVTASIVSPKPVKVGDKVRLRVWSANGANYRLDWWAHRSLPTRWGTKLDAEGRLPMFRDIVASGNMGTPVPATVLTLGATAALNTWTTGNDTTRNQWIDFGSLPQQNGVAQQNRIYIADPAGAGVMTQGDGIPGTGTSAIQASTGGALIHGDNCPTQWRGDRLYIPTPPVA